MRTRPFGPDGPHVAPLAPGCAGMSDHTSPADETDAVTTIRTALDAGVALLDTADFSGMGHNEDLIRRALRPADRGKAVLSVKFRALRGPDGAFLGIEGRPAPVRNALAHSLRRLGTDHVDVYRRGRLAPDTPVEDTVAAVAELVQAGYVRHIGLSEVGPETIRRAHAVHPICDVQARRPHRVQDAPAAAGLVLTDAEPRAIDAAVPADAMAGTRYAAPLMALLDSERGARPPATERGRLSAS
ncbi:aldo/keto reductase [Streptomyces sp. NPDC059629]|uniref:aldo/keto reductase n=1 Tax=Streptomyces sp. NPDC059629 TaxID=3346889 RepID=UPI0036A1B0CC